MSNPELSILELARAEAGENPFYFPGGHTQYVRRLDGGALRAATLAWDEAMRADLVGLGATPPDAEAAARLGDRLRAFLLELGWAEDEARLRARAASGEPSRLRLRFAAAELYALPWELVAVGEERLRLGSLPGMDLRYTWPGSARGSAASPREGGRLLFAWSDGGGPVPRAAHEAAIRRSFAAAGWRWDSHADALPRATYGDIARALREAAATDRPFTALHLLAHGAPLPRGGVGLALGEDRLDGATLRELLAGYSAHLRLVVICACRGADPGGQGQHLGSVALGVHQAGVPTVIASRLPLSVPGSALLTSTLYGALLEREPPAPLSAALGEARQALLHGDSPLDASSVQTFTTDADDERPFCFRPYRGLLAFGSGDARFFFGRDAERDEVVRELGQLLAEGHPRLQVVEGASGTGKSSLVLAGVVPVLARQGWAWERMVPGADPNAALEAALARRPPEAARWLLVVDQLEELFTALPATAEGRATAEGFTRRLWRLASAPTPVTAVIATLRSDLKARLGEIRLDETTRMDQLFAGELRRHHVFVPQMTPSQLRQAIAAPAEAVGLELPADLLDRLVVDVGAEPGALPLLQHTLDLLWARREGEALSGEAYAVLGGVSGALARHADEVLDALDPAQQKAARRLLIRLVGARADASLDTRRRVLLSELRPAEPAAALAQDAALEALVRARLLVRSGDDAPTVEVAHEALIRRWQRLRDWVAEDREKLSTLDEFEGWVAQWRAYPEALLSGRRLGYAAQIQERWGDDLSEGARALIAASETRERERARVGRRRIVLASLVGLLTLCLFAILGITAQLQRWAAEKEAASARDQARIAAARQQSQDPTTQALLLREVERAWKARGWLRLARATVAQPRAAVVLRGAEGPVTAASFSPDGRWVYSGTEGGSALRWRADGEGEPELLDGLGAAVGTLALSPDGRRLLIAGWLLCKARLLDHPASEVVGCGGTFGAIAWAGWSPDGRRLLVVQKDGLTLWDAATGAEIGRMLDHTPPVTGAAWSPDGARALSWSDDGTARVWTVDGSRPTEVLAGHEGPVSRARWSPDGTRALTVGADGRALVWSQLKSVLVDVAGARALDAAWSPRGETLLVVTDQGSLLAFPGDGQGSARVVGQARGAVHGFAFSPDGRWLLTGGDGEAWLWWVAGGRAPPRLGGQQGPVRVVSFSEDGRRALTGADDGTIRLWDLAALPDSAPALPAKTLVASAWSPDGRRLATATQGGLVQLWSRDQPLGPVRDLEGHTAAVRVLAFSPDSSSLLTVSDDGTARIWTLHGEGPAAVLPGGGGRALQGSFTPDGQAAVVLWEGGPPLVWDADAQGWGRGAPRVLIEDRGGVALLALAPDGRRALTVSEDGVARVWPLDSGGAPIRVRSVPGHPTVARFSPESERVLIATDAGLALVASADGSGAAALLRGQEGPILDAAFSPDGTAAVTASEDGTAWVWELPQVGAGVQPGEAELASRATVLPKHDGFVTSVAFSPDGARVVTGSDDRTAQIWDRSGEVDPKVWADQSGVRDVGFTPDGQQVWTVTEDGHISLWSGSEARMVASFVAGVAVEGRPALYSHGLGALLWRDSRHCLPVDERVAMLGESAADAARAAEACRQKLGELTQAGERAPGN